MVDVSDPRSNAIQQLLLAMDPSSQGLSGGYPAELPPGGPSMDRQNAINALRSGMNQRFPQAPQGLAPALGYAPGAEGVIPDTSPLLTPPQDQNVRPPIGQPDPAGAANPTRGIAPIRMPTAVPPPATPPPPAVQATGAPTQQPEERESPQDETPEPSRERGPDSGEGRPADQTDKPGGKVAKTQDNLKGLAKALGGITGIKSPQGPPVVTPHVPTATVPHPSAPGRANVQIHANPFGAGVLNRQIGLRTLGDLLRGR